MNNFTKGNDDSVKIEISEEGKEKSMEETKKDHEGKQHKDEEVLKNKKREKAKKLLKQLRQLEEENKKLKAENKELNERLLRRLADFENYKKRVSQEKEQYLKENMGRFILDLLSIVDNFERAIQHLTEEEKKTPLAQGIQLTYKQLMDLLNKYNVQEIDTSTGEFNPHFHQPLDKEEVEENIEEPMISQVYQKGYLFNGSVLRPTLIKVKVKKEETKDGSEEEKGEDKD